MGSRGASSGRGSSNVDLTKLTDAELNKSLNNIKSEIQKVADKMNQALQNRAFGDTTRPKGYGALEKKANKLWDKRRAIESEQVKRFNANYKSNRETAIKESQKRAKSIARIQAGSKEGRKEKKMYQNMVEGFAGTRNPYHGK